MQERNFPSRFVLGGIAFLLCLAAAGVFLMSESAVLQTISGVIVVSYLVFAVASDWVEAWLNERHVEAHPHLLKNEAVGEIVTVTGDFEARSGAAHGVVLLRGETWSAYSPGDDVPKDGDIMIVRAREGLTLVVQSQ